MTEASLVAMGRMFDKAILPTLQTRTLGRKFIPRNNEQSGRGIGQTSVKTYGYGTTSAAITDYQLVRKMGDRIIVGDSSVNIPVQQDEITIPRRNYETMLLDGHTPQPDMVIELAGKLATELDQIIIDGWKPDGTNYEIKGMFQIAGNSTAGTDFGTYGHAISSVATLIDLIEADNVFSEGYNLILPSTQFVELQVSKSSNDVAEWPQVIDILNSNAPNDTKPGRIYKTNVLAATKGIVAPVATPANMQYFDLIEAQQPTNNLYYQDGNVEKGDIIVQMAGACVPRFKHLSSGLCPAIGVFTAI